MKRDSTCYAQNKVVNHIQIKILDMIIFFEKKHIVQYLELDKMTLAQID